MATVAHRLNCMGREAGRQKHRLVDNRMANRKQWSLNMNISRKMIRLSAESWHITYRVEWFMSCRQVGNANVTAGLKISGNRCAAVWGSHMTSVQAPLVADGRMAADRGKSRSSRAGLMTGVMDVVGLVKQLNVYLHSSPGATDHIAVLASGVRFAMDLKMFKLSMTDDLAHVQGFTLTEVGLLKPQSDEIVILLQERFLLGKK